MPVALSCGKCDFRAASADGLTVHVAQMHRERWACDECPATLDTKSQWQEHARTYHGKAGASPARAAAAAVVVSSPPPVAPEASFKAGKNSRNYACTHADCSFATKDSRQFLHHLRDTHAEHFAIFYCDKCSYASKFLAKVKRHEQLIHAKPLQQPAPSGAPAAAAAVDSILSGGPPSMVPYSTPTMRNGSASPTPGWLGSMSADASAIEQASDLSIDEPSKLHIAEEPASESEGCKFRCALCPYTTNDAARYRKHERCHQTTAETACRYCDFKTVYSWNLDRHVRCHGVKGRYQCRRCTFSQNTRQSMSFHLQHHHNILTETSATQTDERWADLLVEGVPERVCAEGERFIFETHAVRVSDMVTDDGGVCEAVERGTPPSPALKRELLLIDERDGDSPALSQSAAASPAPAPGAILEKLADQSGVQPPRRYQTEQEAIETPTDRIDLREVESDADVKNRTCSICGYQGKWVSEMIRHRRVHTNERPFKCRYCSRTSKWKADLIRHVAKIHGIRVVSKYSRSKPTDADIAGLTGGDDQNSGCGGVADDAERSESQCSSPFVGGGDDELNEDGSFVDDLAELPAVTAAPRTAWVCDECGFEQDNRAVLFDHLKSVHDLAAYGCSACHFGTNVYRDALVHSQSAHDDEPECRLLKRLSQKQHDHIDWPSVMGNGTASKRSSVSGEERPAKRAKFDKHQALAASTLLSAALDSAARAINLHTCPTCPFVTESESLLKRHAAGHGTPKGLLSYKCLFCDWYARSKQQVFEHLCLHTDQPSAYIAEIERNLITPLTATEHAAQVPGGGGGGGEAASDRRFRCQWCVYTAPTPERLEQHAAGHRRNKAHASPVSAPAASAGQQQPHTPMTVAATAAQLESDFGGVLADFGALIDAVENPASLLETTNGVDSDGHSSTAEGADSDAESGSEPEIEDREAYLHAGEDTVESGLAFIRRAPAEIQKVKTTVDGQTRSLWQCRYCPHVSKRRANVRMHEKKHFKANPIGLLKCPKCNYRGDRRSLNAHYRVHVPDAVMPNRYPCSRCPANFRCQEDLRGHLAYHGSPNVFACADCDYAVPSAHELRLHSRVHGLAAPSEASERNDSSPDLPTRVASSPPPPPPVAATHPAKPAAASPAVKPDGTPKPPQTPKPKNYACTKCSARFSDNTQLKRHSRFHGVQMKHACPRCDYSVPFPINLIKHLRSHHNIPIVHITDVDALYGSEQLSPAAADGAPNDGSALKLRIKRVDVPQCELAA